MSSPVFVMTVAKKGSPYVLGAHCEQLRPVADSLYNSGQTKEGGAMAGDSETWRDWHRLFGLLLTDFFTDSPFAVEVECDLSVQQQLLDVLIVRRSRGR
jgi:hypothetical protein